MSALAARVLEGEVLPPLSGKEALRAHAGAATSRFVYSPSPFKPGAVRMMVLPQGGTIADAIAMTGMGPKLRRHARVYLAGHLIDERHWKRIRPKPGADFFIRIELKGGGDDLLRTVAMIAVVVVASMFNPFAAGSIASSLFMFGAMTIGSMLVNALIPPPQAKQDPWRFDQQEGNPYASITGIRNSYAPYAPIPRVMGTKRMYPMLAARPYTEIQGSIQYLRMLLLAGYGPIDVSDIRIGNAPIAAFPGTEVEVLEGWPSDAPPTLFTRQIREDGFQVFLQFNVWTTRVTEFGTEEASIDITFPAGLYAVDPDDGKIDHRQIRFSIEWSADNATWVKADWIDGRAEWGTGTDGQIFVREKSKQTQVRSGRFKVTGAADGRHYIRVRRDDDYGPSYVVDDAYWTILRSIRVDDPVKIPGMCLIGLRLKATQQLNGVPDIINCLASAYHDVYDPNTETWTPRRTSNAAWQVTDLLRKRGALALTPDARLNLDPADPRSFVAWAQANDATAPNATEKRWFSDIVLEGGSIWSASQILAASCRAQLTIVDGKYGVVRDIEQEAPAAHISPRNSWGYRGSKAFTDLPHALRVTYSNPDQNDQTDEIIVYRDGYDELGLNGNTAATKFDTLGFPAIRSAKLAWREARYHLAVLELRPEEHSVMQDFESLACTNGSLVRFSHDAVSIGLAQGRIQVVEQTGGFVTAVELDCEMELVEGVSYGLRVRHADGSSSVHPLVSHLGLTNRVTFQTPVAVAIAPEIGDMALFGEASIESAPMVVKRIERFQEFTARIVMVDAQPGIYTADTGPIPKFQTYINRNTPIDRNEQPRRPILWVRSDETVILRQSDGTLVERVEMRLDTYVSAGVAVSGWQAEWRFDDTIGDNWMPVAVGQERIDAPLFLLGQAAGQVIHVRARVISIFGVPSEWEYVWDHIIIGKSSAPEPPTSLVATAQLEGGVVTWTPSTSLDVAGYFLRYGGANWEAATDLGFIPGANVERIYHTIALSGGETFRMKAADVVGNLSAEATCTSTGRSTASGGVITDWRGLPTNALLGQAIVRSVASVLSSSSSSSIGVAAHDVYAPNQTIALPSDTITGLSTDTLYFVFWDFQAGDYVVTTSLSTYASDATGRYMIVGYQRTQTGGGGFTPPPPPPPGGETLPYNPMPV